MRRVLVRLLMIVWLVALAATWWLMPPSPRYELPAAQAWTNLSDDGQTLLIGNLRKSVGYQEAKREVDLNNVFAEALAGPPPGSTMELSVRDPASGRLRQKFETPAGLVFVASADGSLLAGASNGGSTLSLWDTRKGAQVATLECSPFNTWVELPPLAMSADGQRVAYASPHPDPPQTAQQISVPSVVRIWNAQSTAESLTILDARPPLALTRDGKLLAASGDDQAVRVWNADDGSLLGTLPAHTFRVSAIAFSPDSRRLAAAANSHSAGGVHGDRRPTEIKLFGIEQHTELASLDVPVMDLRRLAFDPSGQILTADGTLIGQMAWNVGRLPPTAFPAALQAGAISQDGAWMAVTQGEAVSLPFLPMLNNQYVHVIDTVTGETRVDLRLPIPKDPNVNSQVQPLAFTPDGKTLLVHVTRHDTNWHRLATGRYESLIPRPGQLNICGELWGVDLATSDVKFQIPSQVFSVGAEARFADNGRLLLTRIQRGTEGQHITLAAWDLPPRRSRWISAVLTILTVLTVAGIARRLWRIRSRQDARH